MAVKIKKRGQLAIWVIIAIAFVASIILFFFFERRIVTTVGTDKEFEIESFIDECAKKYMNEAVDMMLQKGGFIEDENTKLYNGINVSYLCKNLGNYNPCVNQHPMLINELGNEIKNYIETRIDFCFDDFRLEIEKRKGNVNYGNIDVDVKLGEDRIYLTINKDATIRKDDVVQNFDKFEVEIINPIYNLANIAIEIASQEAKYCYFEYVGYMILYPRYDIKKNAMSDSTKIYTIKDKQTKKEMNIAIRSCAIPPGI